MFTGIVEELGEVRARADHRLVIGCAIVSADSPIGASIAVNGTCLTVVANDGETLAFDLSEETESRTSLRRLRPGDRVNLERPVSLATRLGGHVVQGHVDGVGEVAELHEDGITVALIPHTLSVTTLGAAAPGDQVNLEVDVIARYAERLVQGFGTEGRT